MKVSIDTLVLVGWKARQLREIALQAIQTRKSGRRPPLDALNAFLENVNCCQQANALIDP